MSHVLNEVLDANAEYSASFGERANLAIPRRAVSQFSPAWMRGSIRRSLPGWRKAMPM